MASEAEAAVDDNADADCASGEGPRLAEDISGVTGGMPRPYRPTLGMD